MEVSFGISLEGNVHLALKAGSDGTCRVVVNAELVGLGPNKFYSSHFLADVADGHCHFIGLVWLDI